MLNNKNNKIIANGNEMRGRVGRDRAAVRCVVQLSWAEMTRDEFEINIQDDAEDK